MLLLLLLLSLIFDDLMMMMRQAGGGRQAGKGHKHTVGEKERVPPRKPSSSSVHSVF